MPRVRGWVDASQTLAQLAAQQAGLTGSQTADYVAQRRYDAATTALASIVSQTALKEQLFDQWAKHKAIADRHGLRFISYAGGSTITASGQAINDPMLFEFFKAFNYSDDVVDLYAQLIEEWRRIGGYEFNIFSDISAPSQSGSWGALRYLGDKTRDGIKSRATINKSSPIQKSAQRARFNMGLCTAIAQGSPTLWKARASLTSS